MEEDLMLKIHMIGQLVDRLDIQIFNCMDINEIDLTLIKEIEKRFNELEIGDLSSDVKIVYYYTHANYQAHLKKLVLSDFKLMKKSSSIVKKFGTLDDFILKNYSERIDEYRRAILLIEKGSKITPLYLSQVYVNLANLYHEMGRVIESIQTLNDSSIVKGFPMAKANLAIKHYSLATRTTDETVMKYLMEKGLELLSNTLEVAKEKYIPLESFEQFRQWEVYFENSIDNNLYDKNMWSDQSDVDDLYKNWCCSNHLSLNYMNVIYPLGNVDDIHMPDMGIGYFGEEYNMEYYAWFNTIKQEYNNTRYMIYSISNLEDFANEHESQYHNFLINTLDYPALGYKTETLKTAFKQAYSVLDKIGLFCSHFHGLNDEVHKIDFHAWYKKIKRSIALESSFNALYWLSQDLDTNKGALKEIRQLRNYMEHRFVRVLESTLKPLEEEFAEKDKFEYIISISNLERITMETMKLVRSAIFYMASGFNIEFNKFYYDENRKFSFIPLRCDVYDDEWKN